MKNLIWIASFPKSGNTWVRSIVYTALMGDVDLNRLAAVVPAFNALDIASPSHTNRNDLDEHVAHWDRAQKIVSESALPKAQFFKTHNAAALVNDVDFPNREYTSRAVYIVRDPRDVAVSYARHYECDINEAVRWMLNDRNYAFNDGQAEFLSSWKNHIVSWNTKQFPVLFMRYEDLLNDTQKQIGRLLKFLGIRSKLSPQKLIELTSFESLQGKEAAGGFREAVDGRQFFWRGKSGLGKSFIGADFKDLETEFADVMKHFNYL